MNKDIWLSEEIFYWVCVSNISSYPDYTYYERAYEIWERASDLIEKNDTVFDLADGILNLKKSLDSRLKAIEKIYNFRKIESDKDKKGYLELLEDYGIVRPLIMKNLMEIRNLIEHEDASPPDQSRCRELADVIWYFLKSTDSLVRSLANSFEFMLYDNGEETDYFFSLEINYDTHDYMELRGWFPSEAISLEKKDNYSFAIATEFHDKYIWNHPRSQKGETLSGKYINCIINKTNTIDYKNIISYIINEEL